MVGPESRRADRLRQFGGERGVGGRERHRGRQAARHVGGKARPRQNRRHCAGRAFGDHLAHEFLAAALDALGADDHRRARGEAAARASWRRARTAWAGTTSRSASAPRGFSDVARDGDAVIEPHAGQETAFALGLQRVGVGGVLLPQRDLAAGARAGQRQSRAPSAAADDRDVIESHFLSALGHGGHSVSPRKQFRNFADQSRRLADEQALQVRAAGRPGRGRHRAPARSTSERLENSRFSPSVASPIAMVSKRRQRW